METGQKSRKRIFLIGALILLGLIIFVSAAEFTPQGNINLHNVYGIFNATNISTTNLTATNISSTYIYGTHFSGNGSSLYGILPESVGLTHLSNFTDDLGNRGYTNLLNFTNGPGFYNSSNFVISDYYTKTETNAINTSMKNYVDYTNGTMKSYADAKFQPLSSKLTSLAGLTPASSLIIGDGLGTWETITPASFISTYSILTSSSNIGNWTADKPLYATLSYLTSAHYNKTQTDTLLNAKVSWSTLWTQVYNETEVNAINTSMKNYVDAQNTSQNNYIAATNQSMKNYADSTFFSNIANFTGTLTNDQYCKYITGSGIVCNYAGSTAESDPYWTGNESLVVKWADIWDQVYNETEVDNLLLPKVSWTDLWGQVYNETEVNAINTSMKNYVDSNPGNYIASVVEDTTPQLGGYLDTNGQNIGSTTDEIENVYVATNSRIYFGDAQESSIYYNGTQLIINGA